MERRRFRSVMWDMSLRGYGECPNGGCMCRYRGGCMIQAPDHTFEVPMDGRKLTFCASAPAVGTCERHAIAESAGRPE